MANILISGIPGTGKTTLGDYLAAHHGYTHVNVEAESFRVRTELENDTPGFLATLQRDNVVLTWGFSPYVDRPTVEKVLAAGYKMVWLDGDRAVALRNFLRRENGDPHKEADYYGQMQMVVATEVVRHLRPIQINPFAGVAFRTTREIAAEVLQLI